MDAHIGPAMTVLDYGSAMGFFSLPMARMVGDEGRVVCVDVEPRMLNALTRRAARAGLADRIETHVSTNHSLELRGRQAHFDFALAFAVLHEVEARRAVLVEIAALLRPNARFLVAEPSNHVSAAAFEQTLEEAATAGLVLADRPRIRLSRAALLTKRGGSP
jgi:2-polyprenyl-3-methyl-5-hydroxy-6-metoxy-1,4-benzoquinol methylase